MRLFIARVCYVIRLLVQPIQNFYNRRRLQNDNFTIICSTCAGGIIYNRLGKKFLSPTVNLWFAEKDVQKLSGNLKHYMTEELFL